LSKTAGRWFFYGYTDHRINCLRLAAIVAPAVSFYLTKQKERQADWQRYKFELYKELIDSFSGVVGADVTPEGRKRFAAAVNTVNLIASLGVAVALHKFLDEIRDSNINRDANRHDRLLSCLEWEIREDLRILGNPRIGKFSAILWSSGNGPQSSNVFKTRQQMRVIHWVCAPAALPSRRRRRSGRRR
jgi:hypothetical protein